MLNNFIGKQKRPKIEMEGRTQSPRFLADFIDKFNQETDLYLKIVDLDDFLGISRDDFYEVEKESERAMFFQFTSRIFELFDEVSNFNSNTGNEELEIETKLKCYNIIMDAFRKCFNSTKTISELLLMLPSSLILLCKGYSHCKDCENIYGDLLEQFKSQLGSFFNKMQDAVEDLESKFSKILNPKLPSNQFYLLKPIIYELNQLCELVFFLDSRNGLDLYKTLITLIEQYKEVGRIELQIDSILTGLFSEVKSICDEFKVNIDNREQIPVSESRVFLFKLNLVKKIIKIFPSFIKENLQATNHLVLNLYKLLISCYYVVEHLLAENDSKCFKNILVENITPLLSLFYSEKAFITSVLCANSKDFSSDLQTPHLILKLSALSVLLASVDLEGLPERKDVMQNIFLMLGENTPRDDMLLVSLKLPLSSFNLSKRLLAFYQSQMEPELQNEQIRSFSLYHHAYTHISEYSKGILDSDLPYMENFVVDFLLKNYSLPATILISDMWIYRLRCGTAENLFARCLSFFNRLSNLPSNSVTRLVFKRMIKFLPLNLKERLFEQNVQMSVFSDEQYEIFQYGAPQLHNNFQMNKNVSEHISLLLKELKQQTFEDNELLIKKACHILELCAISVNALEIQDFLRFAEFAILMFKSEIYEIQIAVLAFLRALNFKKFNDKDPKFANVRSSLAVLYNEALRSKNYIVQFKAFSIFYIMAQFTDIRITQETIAKFPDLYPGVKAYVSEVPISGFITPEDKSELLEKQISSFADKPDQYKYLSGKSKSVLSLLKQS